MAEWDFEKNTIPPSSVAVMSNKIAYWVCPKGHKYTKAIYQRVSGSDCPICNRARRTSFPEQCFFYYIKELYPDAINSYKDIFDNGMELDSYIPTIKTGIEYDGVYCKCQYKNVGKVENNNVCFCYSSAACVSIRDRTSLMRYDGPFMEIIVE